MDTSSPLTVAQHVVDGRKSILLIDEQIAQLQIQHAETIVATREGFDWLLVNHPQSDLSTNRVALMALCRESEYLGSTLGHSVVSKWVASFGKNFHQVWPVTTVGPDAYLPRIRLDVYPGNDLEALVESVRAIGEATRPTGGPVTIRLADTGVLGIDHHFLFGPEDGEQNWTVRRGMWADNTTVIFSGGLLDALRFASTPAPASG